MNTELRRGGPIRVLLWLFVMSLLWLTLARAALVWLQWPRLQDVPDVWRVFSIGLRMDVIVICELLAIPTAIYFLLPGERLRRHLALLLFTLAAVLIVHMELSTPAFIAEYDTRPNFIYVEYLRYPAEVFGTLFKSHALELLGVIVAVCALSVFFWRSLSKQMERTQTWSWRARVLFFPLVLALMFIGARSTFGHRPANLSTASFSHNHLANELAVSSAYTILNALYMNFHELGAEMYGEMGWPEIERRVAKYKYRVRPTLPAAVAQTDTGSGTSSPRPNLVIFVLESLGADFVGKLGGLPLTPNLDRLSSEGLWFTQLYATGTRTVRGLEAITTGFPPTAAQSILKRPESQRDFFTLGALLEQEGYRTDFIYGGVSNFDNMGRFFLQNGFERIIEQKDFATPVFEGTWGVSDEDLVVKAHETFLAHGDEPFFALMLSTTNHDPFEFPAGRIDLHDPSPATRNNTAKYTDYAVGKLIELARAAPYGRNTVFLIVADHDARVFGADLVPIERFHIPGLLLGPGVPKRQEHRVTSQIDLAPTLLGLMGITSDHPMIGRDMLAMPADVPGRALMQYAETNAFRVDDTVVIHQPHQRAKTFAYLNGLLAVRTNDLELERDALAHLLWAERRYQEHTYRLPAPSRLGRDQLVSKAGIVEDVR